MTIGGWITFLISTGAVCALFFWCLYKVAVSGRADKIRMSDRDGPQSDGEKK